jgi:hypothetical protein
MRKNYESTITEKMAAVKTKLFTNFKTRLKANRNEVEFLDLSEVLTRVKQIPPSEFKTGEQAVYLSSHITHENAPKSPLPCLMLDIENPDGKGHTGIAKNIEAAQIVLDVLHDKKLTAKLTIALTGKGFRFIYPYFVPFNMKEAFLEFMKAFPESIDAGCHIGNKAFRIAGYRGHTLQCRNSSEVMDCHIHYLKTGHPDVLQGITVEDYQEIINGKPDYKELLSVLPKILPVSEMPPEWHDFLNIFQRKVRLSRSFISLSKSNYGAGLSLDELEKLVGVEIAGRVENEAYNLLRLKKCPICGREGSYVTPRGRLKCHHTSCIAGERNGEGHIIGLPASEWNTDLAERVSEFSEDAPDFQSEVQETKAISEIRESITNAVNSDADYLIKAVCGAGKTHTTVKAILPLCKDKTFLWACPTKRLQTEAYDLARSMPDDVKVQKIDGRNSENCIKLTEIEYANRRGFSPALIVCPLCEYKKKNNCLYYAQFKGIEKPGLYIVTHAHLKLLDTAIMKKLRKKNPAIIIDERPTDSFFKLTASSISSIMPFKRESVDDNVKIFFDKLNKIAYELLEQHRKLIKQKKKEDHARLYAGNAPKGSIWESQDSLFAEAEITPAEISAVAKHIEFFQQYEGETPYQYAKRVRRDDIDLKALNWLFNATAENGKAYMKANTRNYENPIKFCTFLNQTPKFEGIRLINLDATGNKAEIDRLFKRDFRVYSAGAELPNCHKAWIQQKTGKMAIKGMTVDKLEKLIKKGCEQLKPENKSVLMLCHKQRKEDISEIAKKLLPDRTVDATHFGQGRGLNYWKDFDAIICIGWLNINKYDCLDPAMALFSDKSEYEAWFEKLGSNEVYQGIHRIRPVFGNKTVIIIARNWLSELGKPDVSIDLMRGNPENLQKALARCREWVKLTGWITKAETEYLGICTRDRMKTVKDFQEGILKSSEGNHPVFSLLKQTAKDEILIFGKNDRSWWKSILTELKTEFSDLPELQQNTNNWASGIGYLDDVQKTFSSMGKADIFKSNNFKGIYHN